MIKFRCEKCGHKISVEDKHAGRQGKCPKCGNAVVVPDVSTLIEVLCVKCGRKISVPKIHAGKKGKCPKCQNIVVIPSLERAQAELPITATTQAQTEQQPPLLDSALFDMPPSEPTSQALDDEQYQEDIHKMYGGLIGTAPCESAEAPERKLSWWLDIFLYPTNKAGLTMIGVIIGVPIAFGLLCLLVLLSALVWPALILFFPALQIVGLIIALLFAMYLYWYLCQCIRDSALGGIRAPETIGETPGLWELITQWLKTIGCLACCALPAMAYFIFTRRSDAVFWVLLVIGMFLFPMSLLAVVMFDSFVGLNPVLVIGSVASTFLPYIGLLLLVAVVFVSIRFVLPMLSVITARGNPFQIMAVMIVYGTGIADFYLMMVIAHLLGRFYWKYQDKLNWEV